MLTKSGLQVILALFDNLYFYRSDPGFFPGSRQGFFLRVESRYYEGLKPKSDTYNINQIILKETFSTKKN